jgi:FtsZ-binding cell division protein ZapB
MIMEVGVIWTIIGAAIATIATIYTFLRNFKEDINKHIDAVTNRLDIHIKETKEENQRMNQRVTETNKRMDGVYHILLTRTEKLEG